MINWVNKNVFKYSLARYFVVGVLSVIIDLLVYKIITLVSPIYEPVESSIANVVSTLVALMFNFTLTRLWTFEGHNGDSKTQSFKFFLVNFINIGITSLLLGYLVLVLKNRVEIEVSLLQNLLKLCIIAVFTPFNFTIYKFWIFKK